MATDSLIFPCPACGIKLSVPLRIAGISGPCPACWKPIQSPCADDPPTTEREPSPAEPVRERDDIASGEMAAACGELPESVVWAAPALSKPVARPLPRRSTPEEIVIDEPETRIGSMWNALPTPLPRPSRKTMQWLRFLLAATCVGGAAALAYFAVR